MPTTPQDHLEKAQKPKVTETETGWDITHRDITIHVDRAALDDFELLDDLAELQRNEAKGSIRVPSMLRALAGPDGFRAVTDGLRDKETGRVQASTAVAYVFEMFQALNPNG